MNSLIPISHELPAAYAPPPAPPPARRFDLRLLAGVVAQRALLGLVVGAAILVVAIGVLMQITPTYTAVGSLLIDPRRTNPTRTEEIQYAPPDMSAIDTQVEVLKSPALAQAVVRRLNLHADPEFNPALRKGLFGGAPKPVADEPDERTVAEVAERLRSRTDVRHAGFTYMVDVGVSSESPRKAADIANAMMSTYIDRQLDEKVAAISRANRVIDSQLEAMRKEAEAAESRVQQYKNANNLFSSAGQTMAEQEVSTLNQQIASAKAERAEKQAKYAAALAQIGQGGGGADIGAALDSDTIRELRTREAETSVRLTLLEQTYLPKHPEVKRTRAALADIRDQIQKELNRILSSLRSEALAASQREASLLASRAAAEGGLASNNRAQVGLVALEQRSDSAKQIYEAYLTRAKEVTAEANLQQADATVASPASLPIRPSSPNMVLGLAAALVLAASGAGGAVLLAELWTRVLRSRQDVETELGVAFAGVCPDLKSVTPGRRRKRQNPADFLVANPLSSFGEALRNIRAFLLLAERSGPGKLIAITSALPKEGKSTSAVCLARTLALSGAKVALVDCDLRLRGVTGITGAAERGLVEVLEGSVPLNEALVLDKASGAWILPVAADHASASDLFSRPQADFVFQALCERFDHVLLDLPPILGVADARILAAKADRVLFVAQWNKTPARVARAAVDLLHESGANIVGAVLTKVDIRKQALYGYGDSSDYFRYYRDYYAPKLGETPGAARLGRRPRALLSRRAERQARLG